MRWSGEFKTISLTLLGTDELSLFPGTPVPDLSSMVAFPAWCPKAVKVLMW